MMIPYLKNILTEIKKDIKGPKITYSDKGITYINWFDNYWLERFIEYNFPNTKLDKFCFCSVDGKRPDLKKYSDKIKIFFTIENLENIIKHDKCVADKSANIYRWLAYAKKHYSDYMIKDVNLSLAFADIQNNNYLRFPYWLITLFPPEVTYQDIKNKVIEINKLKSNAKRECVCINRHDVFGQRQKICDDVSCVLDITYAGKWRNNTNELWQQYNNGKYKYMNLFKFNICPENMDAAGYCTEKIFDSLRCGCIPIYAGCLNNPEPEIINHDFVIFCDLDGDNYEQIKLVDKLNKDDNYYQKFMMQSKLNADAADYIAEYFERLKLKVKELI